MPPRNFRDLRPERRLVCCNVDVEVGDLVRPCGFDKDDYKLMMVAPADADWCGPLYVVHEARKLRGKGADSKANTWVCEYGYFPRSEFPGAGGAVIFLGNNGKWATTGSRPVGTLLVEDGHPKSPIAHIAPGQCATFTPKPRPKRRKKAQE